MRLRSVPGNVIFTVLVPSAARPLRASHSAGLAITLLRLGRIVVRFPVEVPNYSGGLIVDQSLVEEESISSSAIGKEGAPGFGLLHPQAWPASATGDSDTIAKPIAPSTVISEIVKDATDRDLRDV